MRGQTGAERYWLLPTLCWIAPTDGMLHALCAGGVAASLCLLAGVFPAAAAALAWLFYLSLTVAGQVFLQFQWDMLLLEAGLLAIFLAPPLRLRLGRALAAPALSRFLLVWLLFRLMLSSGVVKLTSGDPTWRNLTALQYHYETQPLPPWTAWYAHHASAGFQTFSCLFLFFVELVVPFFYFAPRRLRLIACGADGVSPGCGRRDRELRLFQSPDGDAGGASPRRRQLPGAVARLARRRGPRPRSLAALDPLAGGRAPPLRFGRSVSGDGRREGIPSGTAAVGVPRARASAQRQRLRALRGDDDLAARDRGGG